MMPSIQSLERRFASLPAPSPADALRVTRGSLRDYDRLAEHHYRAGRPATATRVLVLRAVGQNAGIAGNAGNAGISGAAFPCFCASCDFCVSCDSSTCDFPVAVLVESMPVLSCRLRNDALRERFGPWLSARQRAGMLRDEMRCISRVVVDPRWRGLGLAVRLVRHALATAQTPLTEAMAAMGQVHPFFEKAGMTAYRRPPHAFDARLIAAMRVVGLAPADLAFMRRAQRRIDALPAHRRAWLEREIRQWARRAFGRDSHRKDAAIPSVLVAARRRLLLPPIYFLHDNRKGARP